MNCLSGASVTWQAANIPQGGGANPASLFSEATFDTYPDQLVTGASFSCADARTYLIDNLSAITSNICGDGAIIDTPTRAMFIPAGSTAVISVRCDSVEVGRITITTVDFIITAPFPLIQGINFINELDLVPIAGDCVIAVPCTKMLNTFTFNKWWCCAASPVGCTEGCEIPTPITAPHFLIPQVESPTPVEEKSSVPILNSPLYLSNHTWQFTRNFGRVK